jgi:hypothetical protein
MRHSVFPLAIGGLLLAGACSRGSDDDARSAQSRDENSDTRVTMTRSASSDRALGPGDVRIVTTDGGIDLALIGDSISSGLSPSALAKVREETDTAKVSGGRFAGDIEKMVKGTVQSAVGTRVSFPISAVRDARYENGRIVFDWNGKSPGVFDNTRINRKSLLESFAPADAERFVDAVRARKRATGR